MGVYARAKAKLARRKISACLERTKRLALHTEGENLNIIYKTSNTLK